MEILRALPPSQKNSCPSRDYENQSYGWIILKWPAICLVTVFCGQKSAALRKHISLFSSIFSTLSSKHWNRRYGGFHHRNPLRIVDANKPPAWRQNRGHKPTQPSFQQENGSPRWMFPKIGVGPQNGWFIYNVKPYYNGWFGGTIIFWKHPYKAGWTTNSVFVNETQELLEVKFCFLFKDFFSSQLSQKRWISKRGYVHHTVWIQTYQYIYTWNQIDPSLEDLTHKTGRSTPPTRAQLQFYRYKIPFFSGQPFMA